MSDVPLARALIKQLLTRPLDMFVAMELRRIMRLLHREPQVRRASERPVGPITKTQRARIWRLARETDLTIHEIADEVGLRNSGRVSEVLHGKR